MKKDNPKIITGFVQLSQNTTAPITLQIPERRLTKTLTATNGTACFSFAATPQLWTPEQPETYEIKLKTATDSISERIGFCTIQVQGTNILLNGKSIFLKGVNIHEEIPQRCSQAYSESDALQLLSWAKDLGCNFVRLVHYPHNEHMLRPAEGSRRGYLAVPVQQTADHVRVWRRSPVWQ